MVFETKPVSVQGPVIEIFCKTFFKICVSQSLQGIAMIANGLVFLTVCKDDSKAEDFSW